MYDAHKETPWGNCSASASQMPQTGWRACENGCLALLLIGHYSPQLYTVTVTMIYYHPHQNIHALFRCACADMFDVNKADIILWIHHRHTEFLNSTSPFQIRDPRRMGRLADSSFAQRENYRQQFTEGLLWQSGDTVLWLVQDTISFLGTPPFHARSTGTDSDTPAFNGGICR